MNAFQNYSELDPKVTNFPPTYKQVNFTFSTRHIPHMTYNTPNLKNENVLSAHVQ